MRFLHYKSELWEPYLTYEYTGSPEHFTLDPGEYLFRVHGGNGGRYPTNSSSNLPQYGGMSIGKIKLTEPTSFVARVGGNGIYEYTTNYSHNLLGGYNGGGIGAIGKSQHYPGSSGGGASDIRLDIHPNEAYQKGFKEFHNLPEKYQELEYVVFIPNTNSSIFTPVIPSMDLKVEIKCCGAQGGIYGCMESFNLRIVDGRYVVQFGSPDDAVIIQDIDACMDKPHTFVHTPDQMIIDNLIVIPSSNIVVQSTYPMAIMGVGQLSGNSRELRVRRGDEVQIYECKIYESDVLTHHYIPCKTIDDGIMYIGLYDIITNTFMGLHNRTDGAIGCGPEVQDWSLYTRMIVAGGGGGICGTTTNTNFTKFAGFGGGLVGGIGCYSTLPQLKFPHIIGKNLMEDLSPAILSNKNDVAFDNIGKFIFGDSVSIPSEGDFYTCIILQSTDTIVSQGKNVLLSFKVTKELSPFIQLSAYDPHCTKYNSIKREFDDYDELAIIYKPRYLTEMGGTPIISTAHNKILDFPSDSAFYTINANDVFIISVNTKYWTPEFENPLGSACIYDIMMQSIDDNELIGIDSIFDLIAPYEPVRTQLYADQTFGYRFGKGGYGEITTAGGGGGGWYGGFSIYHGGGGSGYVLTEHSIRPQNYLIPDNLYFTNDYMEAHMNNVPSIIIYKRNTLLTTDDEIEFISHGEEEVVSLPPGTYRLECYGACGSYRKEYNEVRSGGDTYGTLTLSQPQTLYCNVGGMGVGSTMADGTENIYKLYPAMSYNGGGIGDTFGPNSPGAGGGATDFRLSSIEERGSADTRIIVGGGAGGIGNSNGGYGGGTKGSAGSGNYGDRVNVPTDSNYEYDESKPYSGGFGFGGKGFTVGTCIGGCGGGGWYGGSGCLPPSSASATTNGRGGTGGSGYVLTSTSYKPIHYFVDEQYQLTNSYFPSTSSTGITLPYALIQIDEINAYPFLCKDSDGYKKYNGTTDTWEYLSDTVTGNDFLEYGSYVMTTDDGLNDEYDIICYDEMNTSNVWNMYVVPNKQTIHVSTDTSIALMNTIHDEVYDETQFERSIVIDKDDNNMLRINIDVTKLTKDDVSYRIFESSFVGKRIMTSDHGYRSDPPQPIQFRDPNQYRDKYGNVMVAQYLLPINRNFESKLQYSKYIDDMYMSDDYEIRCSLSNEYYHDIYTVMILKYIPTGKYHIYICKFNTASNTYSVIMFEPYPYDYLIDDFLVDGSNMYFSISEDRSSGKLKILNLKTLTWSITPSASGNSSDYVRGSFGKIQWYDKTTIAYCGSTAIQFYHVKQKIWSYTTFRTGTNTSYDFEIGTDVILIISINELNKIHIFDIQTNQTTTLTHPDIPASSYGKIAYDKTNKMFYIVYAGKIVEFDETTRSFGKTSTGFPWGVPYKVSFVKGHIVIHSNSSETIYTYNFKTDKFNGFITKWTLGPYPDIDKNYSNQSNNGSSKILKPCCFKEYYFIPYMQMCMVNIIKDSSNYNFGYNMTQYLVSYNDNNAGNIQYTDDRFVTLHGSSMTVHNGYISNPLVNGSITNTKQCHVRKSDYFQLIRCHAIYENQE